MAAKKSIANFQYVRYTFIYFIIDNRISFNDEWITVNVENEVKSFHKNGDGVNLHQSAKRLSHYQNHGSNNNRYEHTDA